MAEVTFNGHEVLPVPRDCIAPDTMVMRILERGVTELVDLHQGSLTHGPSYKSDLISRDRSYTTRTVGAPFSIDDSRKRSDLSATNELLKRMSEDIKGARMIGLRVTGAHLEPGTREYHAWVSQLVMPAL